MAGRIAPPSPIRPILDDRGTMEPSFRAWTQVLTDRSLIVNEGNPEGVESANQGRPYMDSAGTTGNIFYIKRDSDISGNTKRGWILI